jgi:4-hydroxy-2-oxoheptanedioate aldolase
MPLTNTFKHALASGQAQIGLWCTLASPYAAELVAGSGFDWLLLDTEHTPADVPLVLQQLQAVAAELLPFVQNADEARAAVAAMRYAPRGIRGMGGTMRASHYGRDVDYVRDAESELCLLVQVETAEALAQLEAIAAVDGVDGIFIGPADLSASMGHPGNAGHPEVRAAIDDAIRRIRAAGKAPGILMVDDARARECLALGAQFVAVGMDMILLRNAADGLAAAFRPGARGAVQTAY